MGVKISKKLHKFGLVVFLIVLLPFLVWAISKLNLNFKEGAQEIERTNIIIGNSPSLGPNSAPITIVEFSDFECPFCKIFHEQTFQQLLESYPNQIKFVYKQFPILALHPNSLTASEASLCANEQGKFWQIHDLLFQNQINLSIENIKSLAITLGLDADSFNYCLDYHQKALDVNDDIADGKFYGVNGTPTFFINGIKVEGAQPLNVFKAVIDSELALINSAPTPTPTIAPISEPITSVSDDVYFIKNNTSITLTTIGQNPNISISPNDVNVGGTYLVEVKYDLQNKIKTNNYALVSIPVQFVINNIAVGENYVSLPLVSSHLDGASYKVAGVFTSTSTSTNIRLAFDPSNEFHETDESNNLISFDFSAHAEPNSCNGTCGSSYNCKENFFCYQGYCRNPLCPSSNSCNCTTIKSTPKPVSIQTITTTPKPAFTPTPTPISTSRTANNMTKVPVEPGDETEIAVVSDEETDYVLIGVTVLVGIVLIYSLILIIKLLLPQQKVRL